MLVLIGFMGAGKTTVGRALADRLGLPFTDSDEAIVAREGRSIPEIFESGGEPAFRAVESEEVASILRGPAGVVSLGGGAPTIAQVRAALAEQHVVLLDVDLDTALQRVGSTKDRPLLESSDVHELFAQRRMLYREVADVVVDARRSPDEVAEEILARCEERVKVALGPRSYDVVIASGCAASVGAEVARLVRPEKAAVISHPSLAHMAKAVATACESAGIEPLLIEVPEGEVSKSLGQAERLVEEMATAEMHRGDVVIGVGGGVITDLAGFVASIFMRGIAVVHVPTTLLGQVDAAVGGKTGVDLPQGKNLVGTFHQPRLVLCDPTHLDSLDDAEFVAGLAEVAKAGLISDPSLVSFLRERGRDVLRRDPATVVELVRAAVRVKASVVGGDEREAGARAILNYGHTFAHAIETASGLGTIRHGEAVALGMVAAAHVSEIVGLGPRGLAAQHVELLALLGLPTSATLRYENLAPVWKLDKKYAGGVRFVLLRDIGDPVTGVAVDERDLREALERMSS
ncbi:MAG: 3-dehydroquinate synthase [Actinomycetota bacterium]